MTAAEITNQIKTALHKQFPQCRFSVTDGGFGGKRITFTDDGPAAADVEDAIIATGLVKIGHGDNNARDLRLPNDASIFLDRYNEAERAADQQYWRAVWQQSKLKSLAERAERANAKRQLTREIFAEQSVPPVPLLRELNDWVIKQNEKRLPKWKFRLADDLAIQIHSRITRPTTCCSSALRYNRIIYRQSFFSSRAACKTCAING
jgi:hypothetical protein